MKNIRYILLFVFVLFSIINVSNVRAYTQVLKFGDKNESVKSLQQFLNNELKLKLPITGYFGPLTKDAVNKFQIKYSSDILKTQGLTKPTGKWAGGSIKKALTISNNYVLEISNSRKPVSNNIPMYKHSVFGYIPSAITSAPNNTPIPTNTIAPLMSGSTTLGSVLSVSNGSWTSDVQSYLYKWKRDGADILGAVNNLYTLMVSDLGKTITALVTAVYTGGQSEVLASNNLIIPFNPPVNTSLPTISGGLDEGSTLSVSDGSWTSDATTTYSYQWQRDSVDISNATSSTYVLDYLDPGKNISVKVYAQNGGGTTLATSAPSTINLPIVDKIAFMGDSITAQSTSGTGITTSPYTLSGAGYPVWAYTLSDSKWDFVVNPVSGNTLTFATGGATTTTIINSYLSSVLSSDADVVVDMMGVNDASQSVSTTTTLANKISLWNQIRSVGKKPITMAITPMSTALVGNTAGEKSAKIVELNNILKTTALSMAVPWVEYNGLLETVDGSSIADESNFTDGLHPNDKGANIIGRSLAQTLGQNFNFTKNNWSNTSWITPNSSFVGVSDNPTGWSLSMAAGATLNTKSLESSPDGNWWVLDVNVGTSTTLSSFTTFSSNIGGSPANKTVDSILEVQVISGNFRHVRLSMNASGGTGSNHALIGTTFDNAITSADGVIEIRTPQTILGAGTSLAFPSVYFSGTGIIKFRRVGVRDLSE